jgi:hypothetical protein
LKSFLHVEFVVAPANDAYSCPVEDEIANATSVMVRYDLPW